MTVLGLLFDIVTVAVTTIKLLIVDLSRIFGTVLDENKIVRVDRIVHDVEKTDVKSGGIGNARVIMEDSSGCADTELGKIAEELVTENL